MTAVASAGQVGRRLVIHIYGYQPTEPERFRRRFARDIGLFGTTWSVATELGPARIGPHQARWDVRVHGPDWETRTDYRIVRLDDLIAVKHRQPFPARMARGYAGLLDFIFDAALVGYVRFRWPYALFTLFPLVATLAMIALAILAGLGFALFAGPLAAFLGGAAVLAAAFALVGRRYYLFALLEDWAFASILARRLEPEIEARLDGARGDIEAAMSEGSCDEVLLIGHSLGAVLILHLAEKLIRARDIGQGPRVAVLTIGSSLLKIGLHSRAEPIRQATRTLVSTPGVSWADYQSRLDIMNFYGSDPSRAMGIEAAHPPIVRTAPFSRMLDPEAYRRLKFDFFRTHNQFVHASTRRSGYDYFLFACGPFFFADVVTTRDGAMSKLDASGALVAPSGADATTAETTGAWETR